MPVSRNNHFVWWGRFHTWPRALSPLAWRSARASFFKSPSGMFGGIPAAVRIWRAFPQPGMFRGVFLQPSISGGRSCGRACWGSIPAASHVQGGIPAAGHVWGAFLQPVMFRGAFLQLGMFEGHSRSQACLGGYSCSQAYLGGIPAASLGNYFLRNSHHISEKLRWQLVQNLGLELQPMFSWLQSVLPKQRNCTADRPSLVTFEEWP